MPLTPTNSYSVTSVTLNQALTTPSFTPATNDIIVVKAVTEDASYTLATPTATGGGITWTQRVVRTTASFSFIAIWTGVVTSGGSAITVSVATGVNPNAYTRHSMQVEQWDGAACQLAATPATASTNGTTGTATSTITTAANGSAVSWVNGDWNAVNPGTPTLAGTSATLESNPYVAGIYTAYYAYQQAATAGSQGFGVLIPSGQKFSLGAIEIQATGTPATTVTPTGIASASAPGSPTVAGSLTVTPTGIGSTATLGSPAVVNALTAAPTGIPSASAVGSPTVSASLTATPTGRASTAALGSPTVAASLTASPSGVTSGSSLGAPSVSASLATSPSGIASPAAVGTPTVSVGALTLTPTGRGSTTALGSPTVTTGGSAVVPNGIASAAALGTPTVSAGTLTASPAGRASTTALGVPSASMTLTAVPTGRPLASGTGTPSLSLSLTSAPGGIPPASAPGSPTVAPGALAASPAGRASTAVLGSPTAVHIIPSVTFLALGVRVGPLRWSATAQPLRWAVSAGELRWKARIMGATTLLASTVEYLPLRAENTVTGVAVTSGLEYKIATGAVDAPPAGAWTTAPVVDGSPCAMVSALAPGTYTLFVKVTAGAEAAVRNAGHIFIV